MLRSNRRMKKTTMKNRIQELRQAKGLTLEQLADLTELSPGYLSRLESGKRNLSTKIMPRIAKALGVKPAELIDLSSAWLEIDITGITSDNHEIVPISNGYDQRRNMTANVPGALGDAVAALVVGNVMLPRYGDGDIIIYTWQNDDIADLIGRECVVLLTTGKTYIKTIAPGSSPGRFHLTSFNAPSIFDVEIQRATPVAWVCRA
jgi:transcriptional regulator with XRE-family HTH domain